MAPSSKFGTAVWNAVVMLLVVASRLAVPPAPGSLYRPIRLALVTVPAAAVTAQQPKVVMAWVLPAVTRYRYSWFWFREMLVVPAQNGTVISPRPTPCGVTAIAVPPAAACHVACVPSVAVSTCAADGAVAEATFTVVVAEVKPLAALAVAAFPVVDWLRVGTSPLAMVPHDGTAEVMLR